MSRVSAATAVPPQAGSAPPGGAGSQSPGAAQGAASFGTILDSARTATAEGQQNNPGGGAGGGARPGQSAARSTAKATASAAGGTVASPAQTGAVSTSAGPISAASLLAELTAVSLAPARQPASAPRPQAEATSSNQSSSQSGNGSTTAAASTPASEAGAPVAASAPSIADSSAAVLSVATSATVQSTPATIVTPSPAGATSAPPKSTPGSANTATQAATTLEPVAAQAANGGAAVAQPAGREEIPATLPRSAGPSGPRSSTTPLSALKLGNNFPSVIDLASRQSPASALQPAGDPRQSPSSTPAGTVPTGSAKSGAPTAAAAPNATGAGTASPAATTPTGAGLASAAELSSPRNYTAAATRAAERPAGRTTVTLAETPDAVKATFTAAGQNGISSARLSLSPAELGGIRINLTQTANGVIATVVADHPDAAQALGQHADELRQSLEQNGTQLLRLDIGTAGQQGRGGSPAGSDNNPEPRRDANGAVPDKTPGETAADREQQTLTVTLSSGALIDVTV